MGENLISLEYNKILDKISKTSLSGKIKQKIVLIINLNTKINKIHSLAKKFEIVLICLELIEKTDLKNQINHMENFTLFLPSNNAMNQVRCTVLG